MDIYKRRPIVDVGGSQLGRSEDRRKWNCNCAQNWDPHMLYHRVSAMQAINPSHNPYSPFTIFTGHWYAGLYDHWGPQGWYCLLWWSRISRRVACWMNLWAWDGVSSSICCVYTAQCDENTSINMHTCTRTDTHTHKPAVARSQSVDHRCWWTGTLSCLPTAQDCRNAFIHETINTSLHHKQF